MDGVKAKFGTSGAGLLGIFGVIVGKHNVIQSGFYRRLPLYHGFSWLRCAL
jgi:hypothetical protein